MEELDSRNMTMFDRSNADAAHQYVISGLAQGSIKEVHIEASFRFDEAEAYCVIDVAEGSCRIFEGPGSSFSSVRVELMRALSTSPSLHTLALQAEGHFTEEEVCELFGGIASNSCPSLTTLSIQIDRLAAAATATTKPTTIKRTSFSEALATNRTIESLDIAMDKGSYTAEGSQELLNPWHGLLSSLRSWDCTIQSLNISIRGFDEALSFPFLDRDLRALADVLSHDVNRSISRLKLSSLPSFTILPEEFQGLLRRNTRLTSLTFQHFDLRLVGGFDGIFRSLASNSSLHRLDLSACEGSWSLASILDSLHSNGTISDVSYKSTPLEHERPVIEAQLARNQANANRTEALSPIDRTPQFGSLFRFESYGLMLGAVPATADVAAPGTRKVKPTKCRLFLCGRPYAGKSTLARSIRDEVRERQNCTVCMALCGKQRRSRRRGIEISELSRGGITVSLWDMAGQMEYHAIHDFMFPDLSNRTSPSFFVFVFNSILMDNQGKPQRDANGQFILNRSEDFHQELRYWLMFITSKTRRSNIFRPVLLVVITRKDCYDKFDDWISRSLNHLRNQFDPYAVIHDRVFNVDARVASSVSHLTDCIFDIAENILKSADDVPGICEDVLASISQGLSNKTIRPLVTKQEFETLCEDLFPTIESDRVEAIALSLNDFGELIYMHSLDFVVVDTKWFSHTIMGKLIHLSEKDSRVRAAKPGFVPVKYLESLLQDLMQAEQKKSCFECSNKRPQEALAPYELTKLLQGLHLACLEEDSDITQEDAHMLVPAMLPPAESRPHWRRGDGEQFLGRRLRCRDSDHTFLTPGIFPLIQVKLQSLFQNSNMELQRSAAGFICDGVEVWVELAEDEGGFKCIDILARSVKDHDSTLLWVKERVMKEIQKACASDKGIQGVTLEEMVIRPACVKNLGIERERRSQCVTIDQLCKGLQDTLATESLGNSFKYAGFDWPSGDGLPAEWCRYIDLLGEKAALEICTPYAEKWYAAAKDTLGGTQSPKEGDQEKVFEPESKDLAEIYKMLKEILVYARDTNTRVTEMQGQLQRMERSVDVLRDRGLQGMSEMLMFHKEMEGGRYPWMFVVTAANELNVRRIITAIVPGVSDWKLELLCENPIGEPHLPHGQPGLPFATMEDGVLKDALPYLNTLLKFACTAVRVGAHVATGFAIPDFSGILNLLPTLDDQAAPLTNTSCYPSRGTVGDAQQWLWNTLSKHGCKSSAEIYSKFKLQRVRRSNSCVVWVCDEHRRIGTPCD